MKISELTVSQRGYLISQYEALRSNAMNSTFWPDRGYGLALFLERGMTEWIRAWCKTKINSPSVEDRPDSQGVFVVTSIISSNEMQDELASLLTTMAMSIGERTSHAT